MNMEFRRQLPTPQDIFNMYPVSPEAAKKKAENDAAIRDVFEGKSDKLILVIGPCSADREDAVLDYNNRLRELQDKVADKIIIIPRIYTNKPRTTGIGYKGMLHQSDPHEIPDMLRLASIESVMPSSHLILCCPLLLLPPIPPNGI